MEEVMVRTNPRSGLGLRVGDHLKTYVSELGAEGSNIIGAEGAVICPIIPGVLWGE
jgi:hypothetical protein